MAISHHPFFSFESTSHSDADLRLVWTNYSLQQLQFTLPGIKQQLKQYQRQGGSWEGPVQWACL